VKIRRIGMVFTAHSTIFVVIWPVVYCRIGAILIEPTGISYVDSCGDEIDARDHAELGAC
jgi:hypothetical protein